MSLFGTFCAEKGQMMHQSLVLTGAGGEPGAASLTLTKLGVQNQIHDAYHV